MAFTNEHFHHSSTRKIIVAFGVLFRNIQVEKPDGDLIPVPLAYGSKQKWYSKLRQHPDLNNPEAVILPRIGFKIDGFEYDSERKLPSNQKFVQRPSTTNPGLKAGTRYNSVPWNMLINMFIWTKNIEDGFQIMEHILPFFKPSFNVTIQELHDQFKSMRDIPITLQSINIADEAEGSYEDFKLTEIDLNFAVKMNYHGPVREESIIKEVTIDTRLPNRDYPDLDSDDITDAQVDSRYRATVDPFDAEIVNEYDILESLEILPEEQDPYPQT